MSRFDGPSMNDRPTVYLTSEQIHRLSGLAVDAMIGIQIHTDASDDSSLSCEFVDVDDPRQMSMRHFEIDKDGKVVETT
jgi:hypothetical protein